MSDAGGEEFVGGDVVDVDIGGGDESGGDQNRDFEEVTDQGYCSRLQDSCSGVFIGFLLFFGSIGLLIWNEGRTVKRARDIDEGQALVVPVDFSQVATTNKTLSEFENKLIYGTGDLSTTDTLVDTTFGVGSSSSSSSTKSSGNILKLSRDVEMYQWMESSSTRTEKTSNGGTREITTYSYSTGWSRSLISSSSFREQDSSRVNPTEFPFEPMEQTADPILLAGSIELSESVTNNYINWFEAVDSVSLQSISDASVRQNLTTYKNNGFYYGSGTNGSPQVGDTRITFSEVPPDTVSIVALYRPNNSLDKFTTSRGGSLLLVKRGLFTVEELFQQADDENTTLAWILRFVGFILMVVSILLMLQPLAIAADIIPFIGDFLQSGLENCLFPLIAFIIAIPTTLFTIALAWLAYRPVWSVPILVISGGLVIWLFIRYRNQKSKLDDGEESSKDEEEESSQWQQPETSAFNQYSHSTEVAEGNFAAALDAPPPAISNPPPTAPSEDLESGSQPFVPQVYKP